MFRAIGPAIVAATMVVVNCRTIMDTPTGHVNTLGAAKLLGVSYYSLVGLMRSGGVPRPAKDASGNFAWGPDDVERAREAIAGRRRRGGQG